jgi:hypothetical protein
MSTLMRHFVALVLAAAPLGLRAAAFSMPLVDVVPNRVGRPAMLAIWSSTNAYVTPGTQVDVIFPPDYAVPGALNPATCQCIFLRHTSTSAGAWAATEITFTAGSYLGTGSMVSLSLPAALHPGKFYIRFDTLSGFFNPGTPGVGTLAIVDPDGNTTLSQGYYISPTFTASPALGAVTGTVKDSNGKALPAALVLATDHASYLPISVAARRQWVAPMSTSTNAYSTAASSDGSYALSLPPGVYNLRAQVWRHKDGLLQSATSAEATATVVQGGSQLQDFTLSPLP